MDLIIVESPTKAKTIGKFLGKDYRVESSFGHIRDLPKSQMGIDIEDNFKPHYIITPTAKKTVINLKKQAAAANSVILASDEDREGEAIAWHLAETLKLKPDKIQRIVFHEITDKAIKEALKNPRTLDYHMIDAQQARRVLDRLVGYELSPFLWKKVAKGLSAGRVQSVAMRLIVEREQEIKAFKSEEYWSVKAELKTNQEEIFTAELVKIKNKTFDKLVLTEKKSQEIIQDLNKAIYRVAHLEKKQISKNAPAPFTTSTMQQSANRQLGFSAKQTMTIAQKLYEQGFITYMRTDSLNLSAKFLEEAKTWLTNNLGVEYALAEPRQFKTKSKNAQEAHEAIRPTEILTDPEKLKIKLDKNLYRLYRLIWERAVASQMPAAILNATTVDVAANDYRLRATGQVIEFLGYLKIYPEKTAEQILPAVKENDLLKLIQLLNEQHFTKGPARYSDAGLVKEMEKHGIGRPSTYAPTIATIINRGYAERDDSKKLEPTAIAFIVTALLIQHFPEIIDYTFTAKMENNLDEIASGKKEWQPVIKDFYNNFHKNLQSKYEEVNKNDIMPEEKSEEKCDKCGSPMIIKTGRYGKFLACSNYPACHNIKSLNNSGSDNKPADSEAIKLLKEKYIAEKCDKCGSPMAIKVGKYGPFLACTAYPKCKNIKNIKDDNIPEIICPVCGQGHIVKKFSRRGAFYACDNYPNCKNAYWGEPTGDICPDCGALMVKDLKTGEIKCSQRGCGFKNKSTTTKTKKTISKKATKAA